MSDIADSFALVNRRRVGYPAPDALSSRLPRLLPRPGYDIAPRLACAPFELVERAAVVDNDVAAGALVLGGELGGDQPVRMLLREPALGHEPGAPHVHRRVHQHHQ